MAGKRYETTFVLGGKVNSTFGRAIQAVKSGTKTAESGIKGMNNEARETTGVFGKLGKAASDFGKAVYKVSQYTGAFTLVSGVADTFTNVVGSVGAYQASLKQAQAATGATAAEIQEMSESLRSLYSQNLGEDWTDLSNAMAIAKQVTKQQGKELENTTKYALVYRDVFGEDIAESIKAADTMAKNFGISNEQAFNLLAQGAQKGLNKSNELLDSANEYAPYFAKLGFSAESMFDTFAAGLDAGAFNLDKVGDGIKEFGIRTKDGSKASMDAYKSIGLSGQAMTDQFAAGGVAAQKAFLTTVKAINSVEDPAKRNAVAVALFGTQAEDLEDRVIKAYGNVQSQFDMTKNTMESIQEIKYDTIGMAFQGIGRQLMTTFIMPLGDLALPLLQDFGNWFQDKIPVIKGFFSTVGGLIGNVTSELGGQLQPAFDKAFSGDFEGAGFDIAKMLGISDGDAGAIMNTIESVIDDLKSINEGFIDSLKPLVPTFKSVFGSVGSILKQILPIAINVGMTMYKVGTTIIKAVMPMVQYISSKVWPIISKVFGFLANDVAPAVSRAFNAMLPTIVSVAGKVGNTLTALFEFAKPVIDGLVTAFNFAFPVIKAVVVAAIDTVGGVINGLLTTLGGVLDFITGVFTGNWSLAWQGAVDAFGGIWAGLKAIVAMPLNAVINLVNQAIERINSISFDIPDMLGGGTFGMHINPIPPIDAFAKGGVASRPSIFGEAGPEIAIPLNDNPRSQGLLDIANRVIGGGSSGSSGTGDIYVDFAPQITIQGGGADQSIKEQVRQGVALTLPELKRMLQQLQAQERRVSFN